MMVPFIERQRGTSCLQSLCPRFQSEILQIGGGMTDLRDGTMGPHGSFNNIFY